MAVEQQVCDACLQELLEPPSGSMSRSSSQLQAANTGFSPEGTPEPARPSPAWMDRAVCVPTTCPYSLSRSHPIAAAGGQHVLRTKWMQHLHQSWQLHCLCIPCLAAASSPDLLLHLQCKVIFMLVIHTSYAQPHLHAACLQTCTGLPLTCSRACTCRWSRPGLYWSWTTPPRPVTCWQPLGHRHLWWERMRSCALASWS